MQTEKQEIIKARIAELRNRYLRLRTICGLASISQQTLATYAKEIQALQTQLN